MHSEPLLIARDVAKAYGPVIALRSADLTVLPGQAHALLGANGAGKSTFVKALTGVIRADGGTITMAGRPVALRSPVDGYALGIASVFQDPAMVPDLTVRQNLKLTGTSIDAVRDQLVALEIDELDLQERVRDVPLPFLRMLDLARALAHRPQLLILDEITAALPADLAEKVFAVMAQQTAGGGSVLFITHRLEEVIAHCEMCTVFRDGGAVASFDPQEGSEQRIVQAMLGENEAGPAEPSPGSGGRAELTEPAGDAAAHEATDRTEPTDAAERREPITSTEREPRLVVENLKVGRLLQDVSFTVRPGEVLGIAALEGQGQDTLFDVLAGVRRAREGTISVDGKRLAARHPAGAIRRGVSFVPADRTLALLPQRSIRENIALPSRARFTRWGPISMRQEGRAVGRAVERLSIDTRAAAQARRLSGGNQQKLTIGRWLAEGFSTLLLFDPTRGIDIGTKRQIYDLIREVAADGAAVLMYTSELREIELTCDRVVVLYRGRIVAELPPDAPEETVLSAAHGFVQEDAR